jgi:hypothetical protein
LKQEHAGKNRAEVIKLLNDVLMFVDRDMFYDREVYEEEEGKVQVAISQKADGSVQVSEVPSDNPEDVQPPDGHKGGSEKASDVLDNALEL